MKKVVVLALLLFVCVGSLLAQENDKWIRCTFAFRADNGE